MNTLNGYSKQILELLESPHCDNVFAFFELLQWVDENKAERLMTVEYEPQGHEKSFELILIAEEHEVTIKYGKSIDACLDQMPPELDPREH